jgi:hypothetical protein
MEAYVGTAPLAAARPLASRLLRVTMPATPMAIKPDTPGSGTEPPWGDAVAGQDGHPGDILVGIAAWKNRTD